MHIRIIHLKLPLAVGSPVVEWEQKKQLTTWAEHSMQLSKGCIWVDNMLKRMARERL